MKDPSVPNTLLDHLEVGLSAIRWRPEDPVLSEWVFINKARHRMAGFTREEMLAIPPFAEATRETIAQKEAIDLHIQEHGAYSCESTVRHKSLSVIPVRLHLKTFRLGNDEILLSEFHDISERKGAEEQLTRARESARDMLTLIEEEKRTLSDNVVGNLGLVVTPLIDQLRVTAVGSQKDILDLLEDRIRHVTRELGFADRADELGANLSRRETLIGEMIRDGMTSKEIAGALGCAPSTINNHRNAIRRKLGLSGKPVNLGAWLNR